MTRFSRVVRPIALAALALFTLLSCETLRGILTVDPPTAEVDSVSLSSLTFSEVGLLAQIGVENPNPIGISLAGFSYTLDLEGVRVLEGDQPRGLAIESFGRSVVELPVTLRYQTLFDSISSLQGQTEAEYEIGVSLRFDLPVLGPLTIPLARRGTIPIVRPPSVRIAGLALRSIGIQGASLSLTVAVDNPNSFSFDLDALEYSFQVQRREWAGGGLTRPARIPAERSQELTFDFQVSFSEFGRTVRDLLLGQSDIDYTFTALAEIDPDLAILPDVSLPFERSGSIPLRRD